MEEGLNEEGGEDSKEYYFSSKNPLTKYCFIFMEYIRSINPELYKKATEYSSDHVGITITDFDIEDLDDDDVNDIEDELDEIFPEDDEDGKDDYGEDGGAYYNGFDDEQE